MAFHWQLSAPRSPDGPRENKTQKLAVHAGGCACDGGEKERECCLLVLNLVSCTPSGNVLIVSVLLPTGIGIGFALRSKMPRQRLVEV
jgi:hypothetical protein